MESISILPSAGRPAVKGASSKQAPGNVDGQNAAAQFAGILGGWIAQFVAGQEKGQNGQSAAKDSSPAIVSSMNTFAADPVLQKLWAGLLDRVQQSQSGGLTVGKELNPNEELPARPSTAQGSAVPDQSAEIEKLLQELSGEIKNSPVLSGQTQGIRIPQASQAFPIHNLFQATQLALLTKTGASQTAQTAQASQATQIGQPAQVGQASQATQIGEAAQVSQASQAAQIGQAAQMSQTSQAAQTPQIPAVNSALQIPRDPSPQSFVGKEDISPAESGKNASFGKPEFMTGSEPLLENPISDGKIAKNNAAGPGTGANLTEPGKSENLQAVTPLANSVIPKENPNDLAGSSKNSFEIIRQTNGPVKPANGDDPSIAVKESGTSPPGTQAVPTSAFSPLNAQAISGGQNFIPPGEENGLSPGINAGISGMRLSAGLTGSGQADGKNDKGQGAGSNRHNDEGESSRAGWTDKKDIAAAPFYSGDKVSGLDKGNPSQTLPLKGQSINQSVWQQAAASLRSSLQEKKPEVRALEIQLHPAELGKIQVNLHWEGDQVHLQVQASDAGTGRILQNHFHDLRQALEQAGVNCGTLQMGFGGEQRRNPWQEGWENPGAAKGNSAAQPQEQAQEAYPSQIVAGEQLLNVTA